MWILFIRSGWAGWANISEQLQLGDVSDGWYIPRVCAGQEKWVSKIFHIGHHFCIALPTKPQPDRDWLVVNVRTLPAMISWVCSLIVLLNQWRYSPVCRAVRTTFQVPGTYLVCIRYILGIYQVRSLIHTWYIPRKNHLLYTPGMYQALMGNQVTS